MGAKDREHVHVLLRMVKLVEAPEHSDPMIGQVHGPVAPVHRHDDDGDRDPARHRVHLRQDDPRKEPANDLGERERQCRHERQHQGRVDHRDEQVMAVAASEEWSLLRRPDPFDDENESEEREGDGADDGETKARQGPGERRATPAGGQSDPHEHRPPREC